jgi:putative pyruvate formate lyase activating enzyme
LPSRKEQFDFFRDQLEACNLCPRGCGVNRREGETGFCKAGAVPKVASHCLHTGEEPPISGVRGSGTIFFSQCTMECVYCQNYPISRLGHGNEVAVQDLAGMMLDLETRGAHNISLVTPAHHLPGTVDAIFRARDRGMRIPVVYNSSGYESVQTIEMLEDVVQVYLPDMRYSTSDSAGRYSGTPDYPLHNRLAVRTMLEQVGHLETDHESGDGAGDGIATRGLIIRHLVLPSLLAETRDILEFIARGLSARTAVSLMFQYFPANPEGVHAEINRRITGEERAEAIQTLEDMGLENGWIQEPDQPIGPVA